MKTLMKPLLIQRLTGARHAFGHLAASIVIACTFHSGSAIGAGEVSFIETSDEPATPFRYTLDGVTYTWGMGQNQVMQGFTSEGQTFGFYNSADRVELVRNDLPGTSTGTPCGVFVERLGASSEVLAANYPSDGSDTGNCDMAAMLASRVVNRGALNLFSNIGPNPKNVERVDYLFDRGLIAPLSSDGLAFSGHVVAEKSGNNPLQIAAVTEIDVLGNPVAYGHLVLVERNNCSGDAICYGMTNLRHNYTFFQNDSTAPQGFPAFLKDSTESVGMAFVSLENLGLEAGQLYYGFSYFGDDVDASVHTLTDVSTFPDDTDDEQILFGDGPDIYGGVSGYFIGDRLNVVSGAVFKDENGDGVVNDNEAGISDIGLTLFEDTNGNGVFDDGIDAQAGPSFVTDISGEFNIPGLSDGIYFLLLDESDEDLPPGVSIAPGTNPAMIVVQGNDAGDVAFSFVSDNVPDGSGIGQTDAGLDDDAGSVDGGTDAGTDSGEIDASGSAGNTDAGSTDAGTDSGETTAGSDTAGSTDAGSDAGSTDAGSDAGGTDAGSDAGGTDAGSDAGSTDAGSDAGSTDSGSDAGSTDAGSDAGSTDAGSDAGSTDSGSDAGSTDAGSDAGETDAGEDEIIDIDGSDNETFATADSVNVAQGSVATIDVLANDIDGPGEGLTIVSVSESPNATIEIQNGVIVYTPNPGFIGTDAFLYIVEDAEGTQSTGTVDVDVVRFSDINDNGINDFDECDCDNLQLEVGVRGSGLGASSMMSVWSLSMLLGFRHIAYRRRTGILGVRK